MVEDLIEVGFVREIKYTTWLSNVLLVKKSNGKWCICIDYTDLNRASPKDTFLVPSVDKLVTTPQYFGYYLSWTLTRGTIRSPSIHPTKKRLLS